MKRVFRKIKPPGMFFFDSGAFGLFARKEGKTKENRFDYFKTKAFKKYVDKYAQFILEHESGIDYYANVDVLDNPELSWKVLKYLENKYGLNPVPVIHPMTDIKWVQKHVEAGYEFIGIGGGGRGRSKADYKIWADGVFTYLCPKSNDYLPIVRVHGFAMTSFDLMLRYPFWSVDSTSWVQSAAWGGIYVPHKRKGKFVFTEAPYVLMVSSDSPTAKNGDASHYLKCSKMEQAIMLEWLKEMNVPLGDDGTWGVVSEHNARKVINLRFFERMMNEIPPWPQPYQSQTLRKGLFDD